MRINKNTITDTASVQFETGESARARMGTFGTDSWSLSVSPDAAAWTTVLIVDPATGRVGYNVASLADVRLRLGGALKVDGGIFLTGSLPSAWSTFWGGTETNGANGLMFASSYGYLGSNGSFKMGLYWNGFRNASAGWTSLNIGSSTVANALELGLNGFDFGTDTLVSGATPTVRMRLTTAGKLGVGTGALAPTCAIQADGPIRPKSYTVALALALSQATDGGAGALIYVSNESGGAVTAFSDGTTWRRVTDRAVIT